MLSYEYRYGLFLDDVSISASYLIDPFEVESALQEYPALAESANCVH
jgi:acyl-coenzyme A synthetase/AMP-(fatty) acid ligase